MSINEPKKLSAGSLKKSGLTIYTRGGRTVMRTSMSEQPERRTRAQFVLRQRIAHSVTLWGCLRHTGMPVFEGGANAYARFRSLTSRLQPVYLTAEEHSAGAALLLPDMPLAAGSLPTVGYSLGTVEGEPALLTDLAAQDRTQPLTYAASVPSETLVLYSLRQTVDGVPSVVTESVPIGAGGLLTDTVTLRGEDSVPQTVRPVCHEGHLALTGALFADPMTGWGVVRLCGNRASTQGVLTRCDTYRRYTTEEALLRAAGSYGGLTE